MFMNEETDFYITFEKIKSRGHKIIRIHPVEYVEERISSLSKCHEIVREHNVRFRGWDFPHISNKDLPYNKNNYIESFTDWDLYKEAWRYYQSGQFFYIAGLKEDWLDATNLFKNHRLINTPPGDIFGYLNWLCSITEVYEFAARLAQSGYLGAEFKIEVKLFQMKNRKLVSLDDVSLISGDYICREDTLSFYKQYSTKDFILNSAKYALNRAIWLYERFNFNNPPIEFLKRKQNDLFNKEGLF